MKIPRKYAKDIVTGKLPAGELTKLAAERFLNDLERKDLYFDLDTYNRVVHFFNQVLFDGQTWNGVPLKLEPPQLFIIANIYALKYKETGRRKHKHVYIQVGRKNAKTTTIAGFGLYELLASGENQPQILVGANNEKQAKICTTTASRMVKEAGLTTEGVKLYHYQNSVHAVAYQDGVMEAMTKDVKTKDGFMASLGIIDEFHEAPHARLLDVIESGQGNRLEPLSIIITTAGYNKSGPCYQVKRKTAINILRGVLEDDSQFSLIYEPDAKDDPGHLTTWRKANPMLDYIPSIKPYLEDRWKKANNEGGATMTEFITKNLNLWADSAEAPIPDTRWMQNIVKGSKKADLEGKTCWGGLDLGKSSDFTSFVLLFEDNSILPFYWLPAKELKHHRNAILYNNWENEGILRIAGDYYTDYGQVAHEIREIAGKYDLRITGFDTYLASHGTIRDLSQSGFYLSPVAQNWPTLGNFTSKFQNMALNAEFNHYNCPILRWMVSNLVFKHKDDMTIISKDKSDNKIDGVAALISAMAMREEHPTELKYQIGSVKI